MPLQSKYTHGSEIIPHSSGSGIVVPAIWGLHVCHDAGPAVHEVLRLYALRAIESESELLQAYGFFAEA